jgi:hypothetical protein
MNTFDDLWDQLVDPADDLFDADGARWTQLAGGPSAGAAGAAGITSEQQLREIRDQCRVLAACNEFAINGHENRISYIVGSGHRCRVAAKPEYPDAATLVAAVQAVLNEFLKTNGWHRRQQEIVRRRDREVFLRFFLGPDGITRVRFVEPSQVSTPPRLAGDPAAGFGIQTEPDDVETVLGYQSSAFSFQLSAIRRQPSAVS